MVSAIAHWAGGSYEDFSFTGPITLTIGPGRRGRPRLWELQPSSVQTVNLPDATRLTRGGPHYLVSNGGSANITIKDADGTTIHTLQNSDSVLVFLMTNTQPAGSWVFVTREAM